MSTDHSYAPPPPPPPRALEMKAREVVRLTPSLIRHAEKIARDPGAMKELEALEMDISQWAGHVRYLIDATQAANRPWSKTAERLVMAAETGKGLESQVQRRAIEGGPGGHMALNYEKTGC